jgi:capsid protein
MQLKAEQPSAKYKEYRDEKLQEIGRVVNMPLLLVKLNAEDHNYSSARFDDQTYRRGIKTLQGWLERRILNRLLRLVMQEASLMRIGLDNVPADLVVEWSWVPAPHIDPMKEMNAEALAIKTGMKTLKDHLTENGKDPEAHHQQRVAEKEQNEKDGLPQAWQQDITDTTTLTGEVDEDDENEND